MGSTVDMSPAQAGLIGNAAAAQLLRAGRSATAALASTLDDTAEELASLKDQVAGAQDCPSPEAPPP